MAENSSREAKASTEASAKTSAPSNAGTAARAPVRSATVRPPAPTALKAAKPGKKRGRPKNIGTLAVPVDCRLGTVPVRDDVIAKATEHAKELTRQFKLPVTHTALIWRFYATVDASRMDQIRSEFEDLMARMKNASDAAKAKGINLQFFQ